MSLRLAVFVSGGGSNLQALIDHFKGSDLVRIALVISDREDAGGLQRARAAGIEASVILVKDRPVDFVAREMLAALESADIDLIALAGYIKHVPPAVVRRFQNRMINIHPALLPAFGGKGMYGRHVHEAVIASGAKESGATVHYVTDEYDRGDIIAQRAVPVLPEDTPETLARRVLEVEHQLYPQAVEMVARQLQTAHGGLH